MITFTLLLFLISAAPLLAQESAMAFLSADSLEKNGRIMLSNVKWKYYSGDDSSWARSTFDDSLWPTVLPRMRLDSLARDEWTGIGWFRLHVAVDSTLRNKALALWMIHHGASEIYLDGNFIHRSGIVSATKPLEKGITRAILSLAFTLTISRSTSLPYAILFSTRSSCIPGTARGF